ncbi:hypothetical protein D0469_00005, partial [Peribacillus saganii]
LAFFKTVLYKGYTLNGRGFFVIKKAFADNESGRDPRYRTRHGTASIPPHEIKQQLFEGVLVPTWP